MRRSEILRGFSCTGTSRGITYQVMASISDVKRRLFPGENEIRSLGSLTLTTHRVVLYSRSHAGEASTSLGLGHVQWTRLERCDRRVLLAVLGVLGCAVMAASSLGAWGVAWALGAMGLVSGPVLVVHRPTRLVVGGGTRRLVLPLDDGPTRRRQARDFADTIEHAAADFARERPVLQAI
jgi:hypothetical protein